MQSVSIYLHVPFCQRKCPYCHFFVVPNASHEKYIQALKKEWQLIQPLLAESGIRSVYLGGGTPSLLGPHYVAEILSWIQGEGEITLEVNPEGVTLNAMEDFRKSGVNRVSLGVQSLNNPLLKRLGRSHTAEQAVEAIHTTRAAGIENITIDLMYELPGQTVAMWSSTLKQLQGLPITHLSLYNLTFEPGAVFYKKRKELSPLLPSPEESLEMLNMACHVLPSMGLQRYEISAFAKQGFEAQHNSGYWKGFPFLGLGPSAFSYWEGSRFRNICHLGKWEKSVEQNILPRDFEEQLSPLASLHERLAIRLRMVEGAPRSEFPVNPELLSRLESKGWIQITPSTLSLTDEGRLFYDSVAEEIVIVS